MRGPKKAGFVAGTSSSLLKKLFLCESPMGIRQNPWTPTKRRGPIAAEAASPGPAVVSLPTLIGILHLCLSWVIKHIHILDL